MKDILYITLKVQAAQNVSIQNDFKKIFFTINGPAKTGQTGPLPPALITPSTRPAPTKGLDDKNGSQGCPSPNPHSPESPVLPSLYMGGQTLQIPKPSFWPLLCTTDVYQNIETSGCQIETDWPMPDSMPG